MVVFSVMGGIDSGSTEYSASFMFLKPEEGDYSQVLMGQVGFFAGSWLEVLGKVIWYGDEGNTRGTIGGGVDIHLTPHQELVPYLGAGLLTSIGNVDLAEDTILDLHIGLKYFVTDSTSVNYSLNQWRDTGPSDTTYFVGMIGISVCL